jgi:hypothetical protein
MRITVEVAGWLKKFAQGKPTWELEVNHQGPRAMDVINLVKIPREEIGFITVKKTRLDKEKLVDENYTISEGDTLRLYSIIIGG